MRLVSGRTDLSGLTLDGSEHVCRQDVLAKRSANREVHAARALSPLARSSYSDIRYRLPLLAGVHNL
jgi:hypothetical protein